MKWIDKLRMLKCDVAFIPELEIFFSSCDGASNEQLLRVRQQWGGISNEYFELLSESNGCSIYSHQFFGNGHSQFTSLESGNIRWAMNLQKDMVAIGENPSGDCLAVAGDGSIRLIAVDTTDLESTERIADSLSVLIGDVLMGPGFLQLFGSGASLHKENEWVAYLHQKRWL